MTEPAASIVTTTDRQPRMPLQRLQVGDGQHTTHVAFFNHGDMKVDHPEKMKRVPFNAQNPDGPLEICLCTECGAVLMLDDKQGRIRVAVPNVMGYDDAKFPKATYHAFWDETKGYAAPHRRPPGLRGPAAQLSSGRRGLRRSGLHPD
jgi:hypothetical protein